jgi:hypothetical protein|tara:strand:- start:20581 stop:20820 length:240 start_codon:yes stop_codon:yes gene_type:complete
MMQHIDMGNGRLCGSKSKVGYMSNEEFRALPKCPTCFNLVEVKIVTPEPIPAIRDVEYKTNVSVGEKLVLDDYAKKVII